MCASVLCHLCLDLVLWTFRSMQTPNITCYTYIIIPLIISFIMLKLMKLRKTFKTKIKFTCN